MKFSELIKSVQRELNRFGEKLTVDGDPGALTKAALENYEVAVLVFKKKEQTNALPKSKSPPWYTFALKFKGKKETDPSFNKEMSAKWSLFGMNLGTIATNWAAWCGLAMAVALSGVGVDYAKNGALARNWAQYGVEIEWKKDGIPQGAVVQVNGSGNCASASGNHVSQASGDCAASDLIEMKKTKDKNGKDIYVPSVKSAATIDLYGGNQGNTWKVSTYKVATICAVRWPKDVVDYPKPGPVTKSVNCTAKQASAESTR